MLSYILFPKKKTPNLSELRVHRWTKFIIHIDPKPNKHGGYIKWKQYRSKHQLRNENEQNKNQNNGRLHEGNMTKRISSCYIQEYIRQMHIKTVRTISNLYQNFCEKKKTMAHAGIESTALRISTFGLDSDLHYIFSKT